MRTSTSLRWLVVAVSAAMLLAVAAACSSETVEVPGETVVVEKEVIKEVQVPGETVVVEKEVIKTVEVPGETVVVTKEVVKEVAGKTYVTDPTTGGVTTAPEYGGTMNLFFHPGWETEHADMWHYRSVIHTIRWMTDRLGVGDWGIPRDEISYAWVLPNIPHYKGQLAESWTQPDDKTIVFKIREGVKWHDRAPANGRELVAEDIAWNFRRNLGLDEFAMDGKSPVISILSTVGVVSAEAPDDETVVMKLEEPNFAALYHIIADIYSIPYLPEVIKEDGDAKDFNKLIGTGAYMWGDNYSPGTSIDYVKNPDYYEFDEKYPENRLPYADKLHMVMIPEVETQIAAMRTGKLDTQGFSFDNAEAMKKTNPELLVWTAEWRGTNSNGMNVNFPPFDDVRVRRAMQMALDLPTISSTFFKGQADPTPRGGVGTANKGYYLPFEQWPEEIKGYYTYDTEGAGKLLDEAGYPLKADGTRFTTSMLWTAGAEFTGYDAIQVQYWADIGVIVEPEVVDGATRGAMIRESTYEGLSTFITGWNIPLPITVVGWSKSFAYNNYSGLNDPEYDAIIDRIAAATSVEEQRNAIRDADWWLIENHIYLWGPMPKAYRVSQPWLKGYNGETVLGDVSSDIYARLWIDQELKTQFGR